MLIVTGDVEVSKDGIADFISIAAKMAKASRTEDECHGYAFYQDIENPLRFRVYEQWTDEDALAFHFSTPHMAEFRAALASVEVTKMDVEKYVAGEKSPIL